MIARLESILIKTKCARSLELVLSDSLVRAYNSSMMGHGGKADLITPVIGPPSPEADLNITVW